MHGRDEGVFGEIRDLFNDVTVQLKDHSDHSRHPDLARLLNLIFSLFSLVPCGKFPIAALVSFRAC
jgi:hypothetical protein